MENLEGIFGLRSSVPCLESVTQGVSQVVGSVARTLSLATDGTPNQESGGVKRYDSSEETATQMESDNVADMESGSENDPSESCVGTILFFAKTAGAKLLNRIQQIDLLDFSRLAQLRNGALCNTKIKYPIQVEDVDEEEIHSLKGYDKNGLGYCEGQGGLDLKALPDSSSAYQGRLSSFNGEELSQQKKEHLARHGFGFFRGRIECVECKTVLESGGTSSVEHKFGCEFSTISPGRYGPSPGDEGAQLAIEQEDCGKEKVEGDIEQPSPFLRDRNRSSRRREDLRRRDGSESRTLTGQHIMTRSQHERRRPVQKRKAT